MQYIHKAISHVFLVQVMFVMAAFALAETHTDSDRYLVLKPGKAAELWLSGTSNVHRWQCKAGEVQGALLTNISAQRMRSKVLAYLDGRLPEAVEGSEMHVWLTVRPEDLECANDRMHRDLNRAVRADEYPEIKYWYRGMGSAPKIVTGADGAELRVDVVGDLFLGGEMRSVVHTSKIRLKEKNIIIVEGKLELDMRDFDIDPPTALLGIIRAHPDLTVSYRFEVPLIDQNSEGINQALFKR